MRINVNVLIVIVIISFVACTNGVVEKEDQIVVEPSKYVIDSIIDNWHRDAAETNLEEYFNVMHDDFVFIGTDGTENWDKVSFREFCEPYFKQGKAWDFTVLERNVSFSKDKSIVWFDEVLDTGLGPCRGSGVLEYVDGNWRLHQYVLSMLVDNKDVADVLELKHKNDSILLNSLK